MCAGSRRIVLFAPAAAVDRRLMYVTVAGTRPETPDDAALDCFGMMLPGADEGRGLWDETSYFQHLNAGRGAWKVGRSSTCPPRPLTGSKTFEVCLFA